MGINTKLTGYLLDTFQDTFQDTWILDTGYYPLYRKGGIQYPVLEYPVNTNF